MAKEYGLLEFAAEFVTEARDSIDEAPGVHAGVFSSRQSQAIGSLGITRILRKRERLKIKDLVTLAVITSPPRAQSYAEMIALRILLGYAKEVKQQKQIEKQQPGQPKQQPKFRQQQLPKIDVDADLPTFKVMLSDILEMLKLTSSVDYSSENAIEFLDDLQSQIFTEKSITSLTHDQRLQQMRMKLTYQLLGGRMGVINKQIDNMDHFFESGRDELLRRIPSMTEEDLLTSYFLENLDEISELSREEKTKSLAKILEDIKTDQPKEAFTTKINSLSEVKRSKTNDILRQMERLLQQFQLKQEMLAPGLDSALQSMEEVYRDKANTLDDILSDPSLFENNLGYEKMKEMIENSSKLDQPMEMMQKADKIDNILQTNFSNFVYDGLKKKFQKLQLEDILDHPTISANWLDLMEKKFGDSMDQSTWEQANQTLDQMQEIIDETHNLNLKQKLDNMIRNQVPDMVEKSQSPDQLTETVNKARDAQYPFDINQIREKGMELGMSQKELSELLGDIFDVIMMTLKNEQPSAGETKLMLSQGRNSLSSPQLDTIAQECYQQGQPGALGAMIDMHLSHVIQNTPNTDQAKTLFEEGAGIGAGPNLLKEWFKNNHALPPWMRSKLKEMAKQIMIDQAKKQASMLIGSSEAGGLPEGSIRPYARFDDPDIIDLEESIENILSLGKNHDTIEVEDLIVRKTISGRRAVVFLIDISGSMSGSPLAVAATVAVMLMFAFSRDELAMALFESNTHVLCNINEKVDIDDLADEILNLHARGGTQMSRALSWAEEQFKQSTSADKMLIMLTDAMIADFNHSQTTLQNINEVGATSVLVVPEQARGVGSIQNIVESCNGQLLTIGDWEKFPEVISEILSR